MARVTAASTSEHLLTHNLDSVEDSIWESVQDCIEFAGKCLEEVRAVRLLLVQKAGRRGADSSLDYDYQPNIPTTAQLQCLTQPAGVSAFATLAVTLVQHSQGSQGVDPEDSSVRVAVACMQCLGHLGLLKIASMTPTLSDWITALMEAVQVTMSLTAQSLVQQYRSGMGQLQQVATAAMNGNSPTLVTTNRWLNAVCTLFWSTTARLSVPRLASKGVLTKERMGALHVASLVLLQHWYAVPAGALEFLLKGWGELARGAKQVEDTSPSLYQSMGLHQHVVDVVACIVAYHVQLGAVASLDSCGGWELMDQAACAGALRATLYAVPVPVLRVGSAEAIDVLTCAQAQVRSGDWVDEYSDSSESRRSLYVMLKQCSHGALGDVCRLYESTLTNFTRHALTVADQCHVTLASASDSATQTTVRVAGALLRGQCASLMRDLSSLLWPLTMVHRPNTVLTKERTDGGGVQETIFEDDDPPTAPPAPAVTPGQDPLQLAVASLMGKLLGEEAAQSAASFVGQDLAGGAVQRSLPTMPVPSSGYTAAMGAAAILQWMFDIMLLSLGACLPRVATGEAEQAATASDDDMTLNGVAQVGLDMTEAALEALVADLAAVTIGGGPADPLPGMASSAQGPTPSAMSPAAAKAAVKQLHALMFASGAVTASERSHTWLEGSILDCFTPLWHVYVKERKQGYAAVVSSKVRSGFSRAVMAMRGGMPSVANPMLHREAEQTDDDVDTAVTPLLAHFLRRMKLKHPHELVDMMMMKLVANLRQGEGAGQAGVRACPVSGGVDQVVTQTVVTFTSMVDHVVPRQSSDVMAALPPALTDLLCTLTVRTLVNKSPAVLFPLLSHPRYGRWRTYVFLALSRLLFSHARVLSTATAPLDRELAKQAEADAQGADASTAGLLEEALQAEIVQQMGIASSAVQGASSEERLDGAPAAGASSAAAINPITGMPFGQSAGVHRFDFSTGQVRPSTALAQPTDSEFDQEDAIAAALRKVNTKGVGSSSPVSRPSVRATANPASRSSVASIVPHLSAKLMHSGALSLRSLGRDWFLGFVRPLEAVGTALHVILGSGQQDRPTGALVQDALRLKGQGMPQCTPPAPDSLTVSVEPDGQFDPARPMGIIHAVAFSGGIPDRIAELLLAGAAQGSFRDASGKVYISLSDKFAIIGWLRDLRGLVWATANGNEFSAAFAWFRHRHLKLLPVMASAFRADFDVLKPLVRLCLTLANNTTSRVSFPPHDGGGAFLYRTVTTVLSSVVENLLAGTLKHAAKTAITSSAGQLTEESVFIKIVRLVCTAADCVLSGQFVNPSLLTAMGDSAPDDLRRTVVRAALAVSNEQIQGFAKLPPTWSHVLVSLLRYDRPAGAAIWGMPSVIVGSLLERLLVLMQTHAASRQREATAEDDGSRHCEDPRVFSSTCCIVKHLLTPLVRAQYTKKLHEDQAAQLEARGDSSAGMQVPLGVDPTLHNLFLARHRISDHGVAKANELLAAFEAVTRARPQIWQRFLHTLLYTALLCSPSMVYTVSSVVSPPLVLLLYCLPDSTIQAAVASVSQLVCTTVTLAPGADAVSQQRETATQYMQLLQEVVRTTVSALDADAIEAVRRGIAFSSTDDHLVEAPWVATHARTAPGIKELMERSARARAEGYAAGIVDEDRMG